MTDADWIAFYTGCRAKGLFSREPDFDAALAEGDLMALFEMSARVHALIPPVGTSEWLELRRWFEANYERLWKLLHPSQVFEFEDGRRQSFGDLSHGLRGTARSLRSGQLAEDLRELRRKYGDGP